MTPDLEKLQKYGYVVVKQVLSPAIVEVVKKDARKILDASGGDTMCPSDFLRSHALTSALFSVQMRQVINKLFGTQQQLFLYPNFTIRNHLYINWHTDDFFLDAPLEKSTDLPLFYLFNVYLQDNSLEVGGGLDVQAGTQHLTLQERSLLSEAEGPNPEHFIASQAGDLIIFDYRVVHRGTMPTMVGRPDRMALQWTLSTSDVVAPVYLAYLRQRSSQKIHISDFTQHRAQAFFDDLPNIRSVDVCKRFSPQFFDEMLLFADMHTYLPQEVG